MGADALADLARGVTSPARAGQAVTPSDTTDLTIHSRGLYVGTGGNLSVIMAGFKSGANPNEGASVVTINNVPDGSFLPLEVRRVLSANTTASNIVAFW